MEEIKMMEEMQKLGIDKDKANEKVMQGSKKLMVGVMKVMKGLTMEGMSEDDAREKVKMMVEKMSDPEMMKKTEEMYSDDWK